MDEHQQTWNQKVAAGIIGWLEKRRMEGSYAPDAAAAKEAVLAKIPAGGARCSAAAPPAPPNWACGRPSRPFRAWS